MPLQPPHRRQDVDVYITIQTKETGEMKLTMDEAEELYVLLSEVFAEKKPDTRPFIPSYPWVSFSIDK